MEQEEQFKTVSLNGLKETDPKTISVDIMDHEVATLHKYMDRVVQILEDKNTKVSLSP